MTDAINDPVARAFRPRAGAVVTGGVLPTDPGKARKARRQRNLAMRQDSLAKWWWERRRT
ncbi:hypothetical protein [Gemmobacter sp. 24YEA27]|uniref:hypothetical protein n=1 Tax=Gemmobacter sp. 24YEA27 TaxID=3040672 RepID=UPI0024B32816|nr:hypothetical protein [Gemmobacter sp. 24YEA27]